MKWMKQNWALVILMACALMFVAAIKTVWADDGHGHHHDDGGGDIDVTNEILGGDTSISDKSLALGFGRSSFDVDINDCMGSEAWDTILMGKQKLVLNLWCAAEVYDAKGLRHMAAVIRCDIPEIARHFDDSAKCIVANKISAPKIGKPTGQLVIEEEIDTVQIAQVSLEQRVQTLEEKPAPRPRVVQTAAPAPVEKYSYEQKMAVFAALGIEDDDEDE
jgi:hypothetical protein